MDKLIELFKALSDETRVRILILLYNKKLCVCQIHGIMEESQPKVSKHLAKLKNMGLIKDERQEQFIYYYLNDDNEILKDLLEKIILNCDNYPIIKKDLNKLETVNKCIIK
ncbi:ArsR/SmtB family transcription factor [Clostridium lundense]|uniref:ArsR/SmtB family transcription factor n=1 Tax=Clostridium lundense TaxID=319475 RepID=UPI000483DCF5|nr:metalloregulator ArsR/SmtB family transcription factor [Clostridium lundense]